MRSITTSGAMRNTWRLILSTIALCVLAFTQTVMAASGVSLSLVKTDNAPTPVPSGQVFTYTLTYSYSGALTFPTTPGTLVITDTVPATLDVISATSGSTITGNIVTFNVTGLTMAAGGGTVQINVRFKPGVTCPETRACNIAWLNVLGDQNKVFSNTDCVTATATNKWMFWKSYISGCRVDSDDVVYQINVVNPGGGDIGGLNLTSVSLSDIVPTGAIITSVTGAWTGIAGTTLTGGPTSLTVASGWMWYTAYVHVKYPSPTFAPGQNVTNNATLRFQTPCSQGQTLQLTGSASNTLCSQPAAGGWISKYLALTVYFPSNPWYTPSWAPGCCGTYYVQYSNSGGLAQTGVVIDDNLPSTIDLGNVTTYVPPGITSTILDVYFYAAGCPAAPSTSITYTGPGFFTYSPPAGTPICRLRWRYTGTVNPGGYIYSAINACLRTNSYVAPFPAVVAGQNTLNTACVTGTNVPAGLCATSNNVVTPTAPNILTSKFFAGKSGTCLPGCSPSTAGPYYPGDTVRFRMVVANVGSATATPCTITDLLPSGFKYVGNPKYYYGPISGPSANNPTCCTLTSAPPTSIIGGLTSPSPGATSLTWNFTQLPASCDGNVNWLVIEFDVKADDSPTIPPGNYFNTFTFSATNLATPVTSNQAEVTINGTAQVQIAKEVRPDITGTAFSSSANVQPGNQAEYRLRVKNTGMLTLSNVYLMDIMPHLGDIQVLPAYNPRGSQYDLQLATPVTGPGGFNYGYNTSADTKNPKRAGIFCSVADPVTPPVTPGVWPAAYTPTFSFQIQGTTLGMIPPGGTFDFLFKATVPVGTAVGLTACNSAGLQVTPYGTTTCIKTETSPACVTVIPPTKNQCDSIWGPVQFDPCCSFSTSVLNTLGSISELDYHVLPIGGSPSGVVQSISTSPCVPSSTIPVSLAGTTSGSLFYSPVCTSTMGVNIHATSTTPSGQVCIALAATLIDKKGNRIQCFDTICIQCDPAPKVRCDSMLVKPFLDGNLSGRTFTIANAKAPVSPICSVKISVTPPPGGSGLHGYGLFIDGVGHSWPAGSSLNYTQITAAHGLPGSSSVQFTLAVDYGIGWVGNVVVTVYHCDGDSCTMAYGPWDATKGVVIGGGTTTATDRANLHIHDLTFTRAAFADLHVRSIAVHYSDPVTSLVAVTGATYPCDPDADHQANCNDLVEGMHVKDRSLMIDLRRDLDDPANQNDPVVTVVYRTSNDETPTVDIIYYDENGQEVGNDHLDVNGDRFQQAQAGVHNNNDRLATVMNALTARPNPTKNNCDVGFTLPTAGVVDLELVDARGVKVATLISGENLAAGEYHRTVDMSMISSGTYMVALRVNGVPSVLRVELAK